MTLPFLRIIFFTLTELLQYNKIQHDKFAIFDGQKGVTGSYNWTNAATYKNAENCLFFSDEVIKRYEERFEQLWQLNKEAYRKKELKSRK